MLQDFGFKYLPILLTDPFSSLFRFNEQPLSYNFQKVCWDDFAFYFDSHRPAEEYSSHSFHVQLLSSLALNAANFSLKRQPQAWWSPEVEDAITKNVRPLLPLIEVAGDMLVSLLNQSLLSAVLWLAFLHLPLLTFPSVLLSGSRYRSTLIT